ncbi:MAG: hypothetical protein KIT87_25850 [Anaerolineae bacterium]|nr:hypothetical protein [Anaerolineae bacterium]
MFRRWMVVTLLVMLVLAGIGQVYSARASGIEGDGGLNGAASEAPQAKMRAAFGGVVYEDRNGNGRRDAGEPGVAGALVEVTSVPVNQGPAPISGSMTVMTDASGEYTSALYPTYVYTIQVQADPAQWTATTPTRLEFRGSAAPATFNVGLRGYVSK